ncbi:hypothetical protein ABFS83_06G171100 [Erythranthe nasuta]
MWALYLLLYFVFREREHLHSSLFSRQIRRRFSLISSCTTATRSLTMGGNRAGPVASDLDGHRRRRFCPFICFFRRSAFLLPTAPIQFFGHVSVSSSKDGGSISNVDFFSGRPRVINTA